MTSDAASPQSPHAFPVRLPIYMWACFQFACFLYILILMLGVMDRHKASPESQAFLVFIFGAGAAMAVTLGFLMRLFIQPDRETDPGLFVGKLMIRLGLQCMFFEMPGIFGMMAKAIGLHRTLSIAFVMASVLLVGSLLPWVLAGVARYEDLLAGRDPDAAPPSPDSLPRN